MNRVHNRRRTWPPHVLHAESDRRCACRRGSSRPGRARPRHTGRQAAVGVRRRAVGRGGRAGGGAGGGEEGGGGGGGNKVQGGGGGAPASPRHRARSRTTSSTAPA